MSTLWRRKCLIEWSMTLKVIQGYITPIFRQNHSSTFVYGPIFLEICMNLLISCSVDTIYDLKCYFYAIEKFFDFFTLRPSDPITTFIYALMYNFCPYFFVIPAYMYNYQKFVWSRYFWLNPEYSLKLRCSIIFIRYDV